MLSPKQSMVCFMILQGRNSREIASALNISLRTLEEHKADIYFRTGTSNIVGLMRKAFGSVSIILE